MNEERPRVCVPSGGSISVGAPALREPREIAGLIIRPAVRADAPELGVLAEELALMNGYILRRAAAAAAIGARLEQAKSDLRIDVAELAGVIVGYVSYLDEPRTTYGEVRRHVTELVVAREYRRRGIARRMLADLSSSAHMGEAQYLVFNVMPENVVARRFYRGLKCSERRSLQFFAARR